MINDTTNPLPIQQDLYDPAQSETVVHTVTDTVSGPEMTAEPVAEVKAPVKKPRRGRAYEARKAMRDYLWDFPQWRTKEEILDFCRWSLPRDDDEAMRFIHEVVSKNSNIFFCRSKTDGRITLIRNLRDKRIPDAAPPAAEPEPKPDSPTPGEISAPVAL
jgi:hypothetical protein